MKIRFGTADDLPTILEMSEALFHESRFNRYTFDVNKTRGAIEAMLANPGATCILLAQASDNSIAGMLLGYATEYFFCEAVVVQDRYFYVRPESRGSSAAVKLLMAFRKWAELRKANELCINMSVAIDTARFNKLMTHLGFKYCGSNFSLIINY
jgi:GNAT superfamily N-acetyltransferase